MSTINKRFKIGTGLEFADGTTVDTATGLQGYTGSTGDKGDQGDIGYVGSKGDKGDQGDGGYTGSTGMQGATGFTGSQGDTGYVGSKGSDGSAGSTGYTGSIGLSYGQLTSTSSITPATGSKTFTVSLDASATAYAVGAYIRIISSGQSGRMEGNITAYSGTSLTVNVQVNNMTGGPYTSWQINLAGASGFTGSQGSIGYTGSKGTTGDTGYVGSKGDTGYTGSAGTNGTNGYTGSTGDTGYVGSQGIVGYTGSIGYAGSQGDKGDQGDTGYVGSQGDIGYTGSQGDKGDQGDTGYVGSRGSDGTSVTIIGTLLTYVDDATTTAQYPGAVAGNGVIAEDTGHLWVFSGSTVWADVGQIKGDRGDIGYTGSTGNTGYVGSQGDKGDQGDIGYVGSQGDIGYTGSQGVQGNQGDFGYTGSQGVTGYVGSRGDTGYVGSQGDKGDQGNIGYVGSAGPGADQTLDTTSTVTFASLYIPESTVATTRTAIDGDSFRVSTFYTSSIDVSSGTVSLSSIAANGYTTVKYLIQATDTNTGVTRVHSQELTCVYANGDLFETEFGIVQTDGTLGEFNNIYSAGNIVLQYVPDASVTKVDLVIYITSIAAY